MRLVRFGRIIGKNSFVVARLYVIRKAERMIDLHSSEKVLRFFEEISRIPRESSDEKRIADYLVAFAQARGLDYYRDDHNNVIIRKPASVKDCRGLPVILQGHTDMVYVREPDCKRSYEEGIGLVYADGWLSADGTTLGADNGIAVAFALAILDSDDLAHPDLEAVFTSAEEIGLIGAGALDYAQLRGRRLINLDTEEEGTFYTSCAGAFRNELLLPVEREKVEELCAMTVSFSGLKGGHSGMEIGEGRGNAIVLMARLLARLLPEARLAALTAEGKPNAISNNAHALLFVQETAIPAMEGKIREAERDFQKELGGGDKLVVDITRGFQETASCYTAESARRVVSALQLLPAGAIRLSRTIPGLVESSMNPAVLEQEENTLLLISTARSSVGSRKEELKGLFDALAALSGGTSSSSGDYPQWEYREDSPLRALALEVYADCFGTPGKTAAIHAGLECGYFDKGLPGVDIISYGPDIRDVHTTRERMNLDSLSRIWNFTLCLLEHLVDQ